MKTKFALTAVVILVSLGCGNQAQAPRIEKAPSQEASTGTITPTNTNTNNNSSNNTGTIPAPASPAPAPASVQIAWAAGQNGSIPANAVQMTTLDGKPAFLCRAALNGHTLIGPITAGGSCYLPHEFKVQTSTTYEVLTLTGGVFSQVFSWTPTSASPLKGGTSIPANSFAAGQMAGSEATQLYPCLVELTNSGLALGKTGYGMRGCFYMNGGTESESAQMRILVRLN